MAEVVLEQVCKRYGGLFQSRASVWAVRDLNLRVRDGELLALVGPSGCGKTTTLRLIAGLERLTSGTVRIEGRIVNDLHPRDRHVAMVFQDDGLYPHMTARQNMAFGLRMRKTQREVIERKVTAAAEALGIADLLDHKPGAMSGGQRQRIALAKAIVLEPKCFLFDEPLSNLDPQWRRRLCTEIKALHRRLQTTMIYVTHDQEEAITLGDRIAVMAEGQLQQVGTPMEIYHQPLNRFVAEFFGTPPMNFLEGRIEQHAGRLYWTDGADLRCLLHSTMTEGAAGFVGRTVTLGVRPEHLHLQGAEASAQHDEPALKLKVAFTEWLGDQMNIHGMTDSGRQLVMRASACDCNTISAGATVTAHIDTAAIHLFEPGAYGRSLRGPGCLPAHDDSVGRPCNGV